MQKGLQTVQKCDILHTVDNKCGEWAERDPLLIFGFFEKRGYENEKERKRCGWRGPRDR